MSKKQKTTLRKLKKQYRYLLWKSEDGLSCATLSFDKNGTLWYQEWISVHPADQIILDERDENGLMSKRAEELVYEKYMGCGGRAWIMESGKIAWKHNTYGFGDLKPDDYQSLLKEIEPLTKGVEVA